VFRWRFCLQGSSPCGFQTSLVLPEMLGLFEFWFLRFPDKPGIPVEALLVEFWFLGVADELGVLEETLLVDLWFLSMTGLEGSKGSMIV